MTRLTKGGYTSEEFKKAVADLGAQVGMIGDRVSPIDNVTTDRLDMALRMCGIELPIQMLDKIIDLVELIEENGGQVTLDDVKELKEDWRNHAFKSYTTI